MELVIDTRNGIAGDICSAGLIALGASPVKVLASMTHAGNLLGEAKIKLIKETDVYSLDVSLTRNDSHLHEHEAKQLLDDVIEKLNVTEPYALMARNILTTLCEAEYHVHRTDPRLRHDPHLQSHASESGAVLHEAADILVDIAGTIAGLQDLSIESVSYIDHVCVGGGTVSFSHGTFPVPAPATKHLLESHDIPWKTSDEYLMEMATPTGAAILAGLAASRKPDIEEEHSLRKGLARGTKPILPPVAFHLFDE